MLHSWNVGLVICNAEEMWTEMLTFPMSDGCQGTQLLLMTNPIIKGYISPSISACHFMRVGAGAECKRLQPAFIHSAIMPTTRSGTTPNSEIWISKISLVVSAPHCIIFLHVNAPHMHRCTDSAEQQESLKNRSALMKTCHFWRVMVWTSCRDTQIDKYINKHKQHD